MLIRIFFLTLALIAQTIYANPYWDKHKVPKDNEYAKLNHSSLKSKTIAQEGIDILRLQIDWLEANEQYALNHMIIEPSGTPALLARSLKKPQWGSYMGVIKDYVNNNVYYDSIGTGKEFRKLTRAITFRYPIPKNSVNFELYAENPQNGQMEKVFEKVLNPEEFVRETQSFEGREIKQLSVAKKTPDLKVAIYAEGYSPNEKEQFWKRAMKVVQVLKGEQFPGVEHMSFYAVFNPSTKTLGTAERLEIPVEDYPSFLGLYYPYWDDFGRWENVVYPTNENKMRQGLASAAYDYPIILINNDEYWGVGNYMSHTAIPAENSMYFNYLLLHEFGHFFGLNEEYSGGGRTELEFAPHIEESWSQNIVFIKNSLVKPIKWQEFISPKTAIPTPHSDWVAHPPLYGAYMGGYGDSESSSGTTHIPGLDCVMEASKTFCAVCKNGILKVLHHSLGE